MSAKQRIRSAWLLVGPTLAMFVILFILPVALLFASSLEKLDTTSFKIVERLTLANYERILFDSFYLRALFTTLKTSFIATLICLVFAYPVAVHLAKARKREREILIVLLVAPLLVSIVIRTFGWLIVLGPGGVLAALSRAVGLAPVSLMYTEAAVVIGLAHVAFPIMVLALYSALQNVDPALTKAAQNLGATPLQAFWRITFPLTIPGMLGGTLMVFAFSAGSFVTPNLLGGPWVKTIAFMIWDQTLTTLDWPFASAMALVLVVATTGIMLAYHRLVELRAPLSGSL